MARAKNSQARKERLRKDSKLREEANSKLTPAERIAILDARLGKGVGAKKERARLNRLLEEEKKNTEKANNKTTKSKKEKANNKTTKSKKEKSNNKSKKNTRK